MLFDMNIQSLAPHALHITRMCALTVVRLSTQDLHPDSFLSHSDIYLQLILQIMQTKAFCRTVPSAFPRYGHSKAVSDPLKVKEILVDGLEILRFFCLLQGCSTSTELSDSCCLVFPRGSISAVPIGVQHDHSTPKEQFSVVMKERRKSILLPAYLSQAQLTSRYHKAVHKMITIT